MRHADTQQNSVGRSSAALRRWPVQTEPQAHLPQRSEKTHPRGDGGCGSVRRHCWVTHGGQAIPSVSVHLFL